MGKSGREELVAEEVVLAYARILEPSLAAWLRARSELRGEPIVVLDVDDESTPEARLRAPVRSVSPEAARLGARPGLTGAQARSIAPEVRAIERSRAQEKAMMAALRDAAWSVSPSVEPAPGGVYVDLSGLGRLHPTPSDAAHALWRAARDIDVPVRVGVASSKPLAFLAARHGESIVTDLTERALDELAHRDSSCRGAVGGSLARSAPSPPPARKEFRSVRCEVPVGTDPMDALRDFRRGAGRPPATPVLSTPEFRESPSPRPAGDGEVATRPNASEGREFVQRSPLTPTLSPFGERGPGPEFLARLPVTALSHWVPSLLASGGTKARSDDAAALVASFGLKCLGDVAALPRGALAERIGRDGALIEQLARGEHRPPLVPAPPVLTIEEGLELEGYLETFEPLGFLLRPAIERLVGRLVLRGLGCAALELHLSLDPSGVDARTVTVAVPTRDVSALLALVRLSMDARPPDAPVDGFRLVAHAGELRPTQLSLFAPAGPAPGALATTMARLSALVGPERVGSPRVPWTRRPGAIETVPFEPGSPPVMAEETPGRCLVRAMRRVSPPLAVEVEMDERGRLCAVRLDGQRRRVLRADGPYVVEGGWWSEESYRREEHDVTLAAERGSETLRARLVADSGAYYVDAVYDG